MLHLPLPPPSQCIDLGNNSVYEEAWPLESCFTTTLLSTPFTELSQRTCMSLYEEKKEIHRAYQPMTPSYQNVIIFAVHEKIDSDNAKALQGFLPLRTEPTAWECAFVPE